MHKHSITSKAIHGRILRSTDRAHLVRFLQIDEIRDVWLAISQLDYIGRDTYLHTDGKSYSEFHISAWLADKIGIDQDYLLNKSVPKVNSTKTPDILDQEIDNDDIPF